MQVSVGDRDSDRMEMRPWYNFVSFFFFKNFHFIMWSSDSFLSPSYFFFATGNHGFEHM